ncbi:MAG: hypothetical protein K2P50_05305, partial [Lachnospiraceae bacterium]|nr:hypothetical protein [Lachnospiraceae bacterium]
SLLTLLGFRLAARGIRPMEMQASPLGSLLTPLGFRLAARGIRPMEMQASPPGSLLAQKGDMTSHTASFF